MERFKTCQKWQLQKVKSEIKISEKAQLNLESLLPSITPIKSTDISVSPTSPSKQSIEKDRIQKLKYRELIIKQQIKSCRLEIPDNDLVQNVPKNQELKEIYDELSSQGKNKIILGEGRGFTLGMIEINESYLKYEYLPEISVQLKQLEQKNQELKMQIIID